MQRHVTRLVTVVVDSVAATLWHSTSPGKTQHLRSHPIPSAHCDGPDPDNVDNGEIIASVDVRLYFCVTFAIQLLEVPIIRLFESAICDRYQRSVVGTFVHAFGNTDEVSCKIVFVQDELAKVVG